MSATLRGKLIRESQARFNPDVGNFFDKGYIKIERRLWDQVYMNELASAITASGMPTTFLAGARPRMTDNDWRTFTRFIYDKLVQDNARNKPYKWILWGKAKGQVKRTNSMMIAPYVRNNPRIDRRLRTNTRDINYSAQRSFRTYAIMYFRSNTFKASNARILRSYGGGGTYATGQTEEHGLRGEDAFSDVLPVEPGRDIGGPQAALGGRGSPQSNARRNRQQASLRRGESVSGARGTRIEQRIVKSLSENMQRAALTPTYYDSFHTAVQAKWRDLFGYEHNVDTFESDTGLKRNLSMRSNMVPTVDSFNPGDFDVEIGNNWRHFLESPAYFKDEIKRLLPGTMTDTYIEDMFNDSPRFGDRLTAAGAKSIVKNLFPQKTNPDMRLKVNKAILAGFKPKTKKGKSVSTIKGGRRGSSKTKQTQKQRMPGKVVLPVIGKVDQKAGRNPMALKVLLNQILPVAIARNMVSPALNYRTGRFANSVQVDDVTQGPRGGNTMIEASYMTDPYQTFAPGGQKYTPQRNPEKLIKRTVREVASSIVGAKFGVNVQ